MAAARHRRRQWHTVAGLMAVILLIAIPALALRGPDEAAVQVADHGSATTSPGNTSTTQQCPAEEAADGGDCVTTSTAHDDGEPPPETTPFTTNIPSTSAGSATTTTVIADCRNAYNRPECGPFYWDPEAAPNQKPSITIVSVTPDEARAGEEVTIRVRVEDQDSPFRPGTCQNDQTWGDGSVTYGDSTGASGCVVDPADCFGGRNGPHDPPERQPSSFTVDLSHIYESSGTYTAALHFSAFYSCNSPYSESATVNVEVTVVEPPLVG